ncbi:MAG: RNA polymerase sigma factor [Actinomycetota bacterium]
MSPGTFDNSRSPADRINEASFASLIDAAKVGDGRAFECLYRWLAPEITRFATVRGAEDAEGLANEVFLRAYQKISRFDGRRDAFRAWIFAITRNLLIDAHRAGARRPDIATNEVPERSSASADIEALDLLSVQRVARLLAQLSDDQRDVILLRMVGDLSLQQVALIVDKPVTAVKALQRRGLRRLQSEVLAEVVTP